MKWPGVITSGLETIVWRLNWESCKATNTKEEWIRYNAFDCEALSTITQKILCLLRTDDVVDVTKLKREHPYGFKRNTFFFEEFDFINKSAYWDYQRERVYLKSNKSLKRSCNKATKRAKAPLPDKFINCPPPPSCPKCASLKFSQHSKKQKTVIDIKFMKNGLKKWITCYRFHRYRCSDCGSTFVTANHNWKRSKFGVNFFAYFIYQSIGLTLIHRQKK